MTLVDRGQATAGAPEPASEPDSDMPSTLSSDEEMEVGASSASTAVDPQPPQALPLAHAQRGKRRSVQKGDEKFFQDVEKPKNACVAS